MMDLVEWMVDNKIEFSKRLSIKESRLGGTGVFATQPISTDDVVLTVPKSAILSPRTCGIANLLTEYELEGIEGLVIAYIFEQAQGSSSPWATFIKSVESVPLPDVPRLWSEQEKAQIQCCDIKTMGGLDSEQLDQGFKEAQRLLKDELGLEISLAQYTDALLRVSSRAFDVDNYHGQALVPGACLFNHSDKESVRFESEGFVCGYCGALECACGSDDSDDEHHDHDHDHHHEEAEDSDEDKDVDMDADNSGEDSDSDESFDEDGDNVCEIRALKNVLPGKEVFNTYGHDGNNILLARYGFVIPGNIYETVDVRAQVSKFAKTHELVSRYKFWKQNFSSFVEEEDVQEDDWKESLFFESDGVPSGPLDLLVSLFALSPKDYIKFMRTGTLKVKNGREVDNILRSIITSRLKKYDDKRPSAEILQSAASKKGRERTILLLIGTEKQVLERALERCA